MFLSNMLILFSVFSFASCKLFIIKDKFDKATSQMMNLLTTCPFEMGITFASMIKDTDASIRFSPLFSRSFSLIQMKIATSKGTYNKTSSANNRRPVALKRSGLIVAIVSSPKSLERIFSTEKSSDWWRPSASYVIVDSKTSETKCERADDFLRITLQQDSLYSTFFCLDSNDNLVFYTYNPYRNWAPKEWQEESSTRKTTTETGWTLFKRKYVHGRTSCRDLNFDKTSSLNGHTINTVALNVPPSLVIEGEEKNWTHFKGADARVAECLWTKLEATLNVTIATDSSKNDIKTSGVPGEVLSNINNGKSDIVMNSYYIFNKASLSFTYPHMNAGLSVLTQYAGFETGPTKILNFMNPTLILGVLFVALVTTLILGILAQQGIPFALLEVIRITVGASPVRSPQRDFLRIYLIAVFFLFLITGSTFQSSLSSILTSPVEKPNIDDIDDLKRSGYTIRTFRGYENVFHDPVLVSRLETTNHWNCSRYVSEQRTTVCVAERTKLTKISYEQKLYLSKHRLYTLWSAFIVRPGWPLRRRVSSLLSRMQHAGLIDRWIEESVFAYKPRWLFKNGETRSHYYRHMNVADFDFAFYILTVGLGLSILVFCFEHFISWIRRTH